MKRYINTLTSQSPGTILTIRCVHFRVDLIFCRGGGVAGGFVLGLPSGGPRAISGGPVSNSTTTAAGAAVIAGDCSGSLSKSSIGGGGGGASRNFSSVGTLAARYRDLMLVSLMTCASFFLYVNWRFTAAHAPSPIITGELYITRYLLLSC